jgi:hypothetical protein
MEFLHRAIDATDFLDVENELRTTARPRESVLKAGGSGMATV